jgi:hypothetical protein
VTAYAGRDGQSLGPQWIGDQSGGAPFTAGQLGPSVNVPAQRSQVAVEIGHGLVD